MKNLLFTLVIFLAATSFSNAQNGYSLEFEDVVTLSIESLPSGTTGSKTYTVPANTVLKISSGCLTYSATYIVTLTVGSEIITNVSTKTQIPTTAPIVAWQPIWAKEGTLVTLTYNAPSGVNITCGYISGTLFRKVAN